MTGKTYIIHADESSVTGSTYMVIGGLIYLEEYSPVFHKHIHDLREKYHLRNGCLKWSKITDKYFHTYKDFINLFFDNRRNIHFRSLVLKNSEINYRSYSRDDHEKGYYKFVYQLILNSFCCDFKEEDKCYLYLDRRPKSSYSLDELKKVLNNGIRKKFGRQYPNIIKAIEPRITKECDSLQMVDTIMGGLAYQLNKRFETSTRESKKILSSYIIDKSDVVDIYSNTCWSKKDFKIWHFKLKK